MKKKIFISEQRYNFRKPLIWKIAHCRVFYFLPITTENKDDKYDQEKKNKDEKKSAFLKQQNLIEIFQTSLSESVKKYSSLGAG